MLRPLRVPAAGVVVLALGVPIGLAAQAGPPPPRAIPGITTEDRFPGACVDCHVRYPDEGLDVRFSVLTTAWRDSVEPKLMETARATSRAGVTLTGRHPEVDQEDLSNIPGSCIGCHRRRTDEAPDFSRLVHKIHLEGGSENPFLTVFQGECTHCHKLETRLGSWRIPSGPERPVEGG